MLSALPHQFKIWQVLGLHIIVLSGLMLSTPIRAEEKSNLLLAQLPIAQNYNEPLPPPPINQDAYSVPPINDGNGRTFEFQAPLQNFQYQQPSIPQYNQEYGRYSVIVDTNGYSGQLLPIVKRVEPTAYIRNIGGRSVIQAGVFNRQQNATQRVQQLVANGINYYNIKVFNPTDGQDISSIPGGRGTGGSVDYYPGDFSQNKSSKYYVVIPTRPEDFYKIEQTVWRSLGQYVNNIGVQRRNQPRGAHIAVGPFAQRSQAERWNAALRDAGLANARVYYGR